MKKIIFISFLLSFACSSKDYIVAQEADKIFTIYLVRHSEKDYSSNDLSDLPLSMQYIALIIQEQKILHSQQLKPKN